MSEPVREESDFKLNLNFGCINEVMQIKLKIVQLSLREKECMRDCGDNNKSFIS